jgi:PAS domain S-box-containing protein
MLAKVIQTGSWILIGLRGQVPELLSFSVGNSLLFAGRAIEGLCLLSLSRHIDRRWRAVFLSLLGFLLLAWWVPGLRQSDKIAVSILFDPLFFMIPGFYLLLSTRAATSPLRKFIGLSLLLCSFATIARGIYIFEAGAYNLAVPTYFQVVLFLVLILMMILGSTGYILVRKDQTENALKASEARYRLLFENMQEGFSLHEIITDGNGEIVDFRFLDANAAYERHTGRRPADVIGKTMLEVLPKADPGQIRKFGRVALTGEPISFEYFSDTYERHIRVKAFSPQPRLFATIFEDITERKRSERELENLSSRNSTLLKELQHRVKNSFGLITSMISLTTSKENPPGVKALLEELEARVRAVAGLYDLLYSSDSFAAVRLDEYCSAIASSTLAVSDRVTLSMSAEAITFQTAMAAPIGLILTELLTNALKYAFPSDRKGTITINLRSEASRIVLEVRDDGIGLAPGFSPSVEAGMGLKLVSGLSEQIGGRFSIEGDASGTRCTLELPGEGGR